MQNEKKKDIKSLSLSELTEELKALGEPGFRGGQVFEWLSRGVRSFQDMTNISQDLRARLDREYEISALNVLRRQVSARDGTVKFLWELADGNSVESVVMNYEHGNTVCISSQVGCRMGCAFCASTLGGLVRDLRPSEMLDQVIYSQKESGKRISNIVMMGIGEPLDNFENVMKFLELVNDPHGIGIGMRHISLSTCGLTETVDKLAEYNLQLTLSVSLHAPDDETRSKLMPVNRRYGVDRVLSACERYFRKTGRRISYEYAMVRDVNDTPRHAALLIDKLKGTGSHVNLIPLNHVDERSLMPSTRETVKRFESELKNHGINVTVRRRLGGDIDASCGQLRRKHSPSAKTQQE